MRYIAVLVIRWLIHFYLTFLIMQYNCIVPIENKIIENHENHVTLETCKVRAAFSKVPKKHPIWAPFLSLISKWATVLRENSHFAWPKRWTGRCIASAASFERRICLFTVSATWRATIRAIFAVYFKSKLRKGAQIDRFIRKSSAYTASFWSDMIWGLSMVPSNFLIAAIR